MMRTAETNGPVLDVANLRVEFDTRDGTVAAVGDVSFSVSRGEVLGIVGESGSGKSVTGMALLGLIDRPGRITHGSVRLGDRQLVGLPEHEMRRLRGRDVAMIFQDPMSTLNPVLRIDTQMIEAIQAHEKMTRKAAFSLAAATLARVGIPSPEERLASYPHEFSGGMRQRVAIAIALLHKPALLIADEPTTALDVTIQAQILSEVQALTSESGTALIWITHDLSVVAGLAHRIVVMYAGRVVEEGEVADVLMRPRHPYTNGLIGAVPARGVRGTRLAQIPGVAPSPGKLPSGCSFAPRCSRADAACTRMPELAPAGQGRGAVRCFHPFVSGAN